MPPLPRFLVPHTDSWITLRLFANLQVGLPRVQFHSLGPAYPPDLYVCISDDQAQRRA